MSFETASSLVPLETEERCEPETQYSLHEPLRVLVVSGGYQVFGKERVALELMRGLKAQGYDIHCLTNAWNDGKFIRHLTDFSVPYTATYLGWLYLSKPTWTLDTLRHAPKALLDCVRLYRTFRPHIVVHDSYRSITQIGWMLKNHNILMVHDYCTKWWESKLLRAIDHRIAIYAPCSEDVARNLMANGVDPAKIAVVHNPVDFRTCIGKKMSCETDNEVPVIAIVGQIIPRKGHHVLLEALGLVRERSPQTRLRIKIFGDGPAEYRQKLESIARQRGIEALVEWCGYRENRDAIYAGINFGVVPSVDAEPFGLVVVEPAVYQKPVIASEVGGMRSIIHDGVTGFLVPPGDPEALADRILRLLSTKSLIGKLGAAAYCNYKARFDTPLFVERYESIIRGVVDRSRIAHQSKCASCKNGLHSRFDGPCGCTWKA